MDLLGSSYNPARRHWNYVQIPAMHSPLSLLGVLCLTATFPALLQGDPLVVGPGVTLQLGDPAQPLSQGYDSLTIDTGGTLEVLSDLTLSVTGDIVINGRITFRQPEPKKAKNGNAGQDGSDGADNQPPGANAGTGGILGERGENWTFGGAPRVTLTSQG